MANISAIKLPSGTTYTIVDNTSGYTKNTGTVTSVAASGSGGISISGSPITTSGTIAIGLNLSTAINGLGEGTSPAQRADYIVAQYAGGGTTTTTYHRRSLANIFAALNASDITTALGYTPYNATNPNGYTTNTGTVTSVAVSGGTGISVSGSPITANGTITITNSGVTGVKGSAESSYRTGQVNLTAANIGAISSKTNGNTQELYRPLQLNGLNDVTLDAKINTLRANRLAFLPADQIIIEKTIDGGTTWTDAGIADSTKIGLFSETRAGVSIPLIDGSQNINCGLRITITAMKYNVPANTAETNKYNYWNSNYIASTERYNQLKEMYFWVSTSNNSMSIKVERATGANSTSWSTIYDSSANNYGLTGWSGNDYIRFTQGVFGGGTTQTGNFWNYRLTFFTRGTNGSTTLNTGYLTSVQSIMEIRGYGDTWWNKGNEYAANDKIYTHDYLKNVTFPGQVNATSFNGYTILSNVPSNAKFTDTVTTATTTGSGNAVTAITASNGALTVTKGSTFLTASDISGKIDTAGTGLSKSGTTLNHSNSVTAQTTQALYPIKIDAQGHISAYGTAVTPLTSDSTLNAAKLSGAIPSAVTATTQTAGNNSTKIATTAYVDSAISGLPTPMQFIGTVGTNGTVTWANLPAASGHNGYTYKVITAHTAETGKPAADVGDALISNGTEWVVIPAGDETATQSATTGILIANHGTGTVIGVQSTTTTASKVTVGSHSTDYGVKSAGSASTWTFEEKTIPNVTSAGAASSWTFEEKTIPNVTAAGSGSASLTFAMDTTDTKKLKITFSHTHTAPTIGTAIKVQSKSGGSNGTAPTLGTAIKVQSKSGGANGTAPTLGSKVPTVSTSDITVPIKNSSASTFVTGTTHTVTDNGHTHSI